MKYIKLWNDTLEHHTIQFNYALAVAHRDYPLNRQM